MPEHQQIQQSKKTNTIFQKQATPVVQTPVSNPYSIIQRAKINPRSLTRADIMQLQRTIGNQAVGRLLSSIGSSSTAQQATVQRQEIQEEEEPLQGKMIKTIQRQEIPEEEEPLQGKMVGTVQRQEIPEEEEPLQGKFENKPEINCPSCFAAPIVQKQEIPEEEEPLQTKRENNTGMPDNLKAGVESLSGIDMSDVRVHYNSDKPAEVGALAYTQGTNIHVAPGQERHLSHETWHVVQQAQGRVRPTFQMKDISINDDSRLEQEADMIGERIGNMAEMDKEKINALGKKETSSLSGTGVTQFIKEVYSSEAFKNPENFLRKEGNIGQIREEIGSSGITGEAQKRLVINLGISSKWRSDMHDDLKTEGMVSLAESLISTVLGITSAERWVREHSLDLYNNPNIRRKYLSLVREPTTDPDRGKPTNSSEHTYHYDSGLVKITTEDLCKVGCRDPNDQKLAMNEAHGPWKEGFVKGHLTEFGAKNHMYCNHVHVDKGKQEAIDIYEKTGPDVTTAREYNKNPQRKNVIRGFLRNVSDTVGKNYRQADANMFITEKKTEWPDKASE